MADDDFLRGLENELEVLRAQTAQLENGSSAPFAAPGRTARPSGSDVQVLLQYHGDMLLHHLAKAAPLTAPSLPPPCPAGGYDRGRDRDPPAAAWTSVWHDHTPSPAAPPDRSPTRTSRRPRQSRGIEEAAVMLQIERLREQQRRTADLLALEADRRAPRSATKAPPVKSLPVFPDEDPTDAAAPMPAADTFVTQMGQSQTAADAGVAAPTDSPPYRPKPPQGYCSPAIYSPRKFSPCVPRPFSFERREAAKPKTIAQQKFEEDLLRRVLQEESLRRYHIRANPVPPSTHLHLLDPETIEQARRRRRTPKAERRSATPQPKRTDLSREPPADSAPAAHAAAPPPSRTPESEPQVATTHDPPAPDHHTTAGVPSHPSPLPEGPRVPSEPPEPEGRGSGWSLQAVGSNRTARRSHSTPINGGRRPPAVPEYPYRPQVNRAPPDFAKLWAQHEECLARVRKAQAKTRPKEFNFAIKPRDRTELVQRTLEEMAKDERTLPERRWPFAAHPPSGRPSSPHPAPATPKDAAPEGRPIAAIPRPDSASSSEANSKMTLACKLRNLETLRRLIQTEQRSVDTRRQAEERRRRRKDVALRVVPHLPPDPNEARRSIEEERRIQNRIKHQEQILQYKEQLAETYRRLEQTRPFLFAQTEPERKAAEAAAKAARSPAAPVGRPGRQLEQAARLLAEDPTGSDEEFEAPRPDPAGSRASFEVASKIQHLLDSSHDGLRSSTSTGDAYGDDAFEAVDPADHWRTSGASNDSASSTAPRQRSDPSSHRSASRSRSHTPSSSQSERSD